MELQYVGAVLLKTLSKHRHIRVIPFAMALTESSRLNAPPDGPFCLSTPCVTVILASQALVLGLPPRN